MKLQRSRSHYRCKRCGSNILPGEKYAAAQRTRECMECYKASSEEKYVENSLLMDIMKRKREKRR